MSEPLVSVLVTVDDVKHDLNKVAEKLAQKGMQHIEVMPFSGIIGGLVESKVAKVIEKVPGVEAVEVQPTFHQS